MNKNTGYIQSPDDRRDWPLSALKFATAPFVNVLSASLTRNTLETFIQRVDDQLSKPWCVAFGVCDAIEFQMVMMGLEVPEGGFSKAYLYAMCKKYDGIADQDGTFIRIALEIALKYGLCSDSLCPTTTYLTSETLPVITNDMLVAASAYKIKAYARLQKSTGYVDNEQIKDALANSQMVVIGSYVEQDNWLNGDDLIDAPAGNYLGGHCTYLFGYDDTYVAGNYTGAEFGANSWGESWGRRGKYTMMYNYTTNINLDGYPAVMEAWSFVVEGVMPIIKKVPLATPVQILKDSEGGGFTMLPFRGVYEALDGNVWYYTNTSGKLVAVSEVELKDKTVVIEATQDSSELKVYQI